MFQKITAFIYETFHLKQQKHSGWKLAGIKDPDSVAEHSLVATQIGFVLAHLEEVNVEKVMTMLLFHDNAETRIGDLNKVNQRYFSNKKEIELEAFTSQTKLLPPKIEKIIIKNFKELEEKKSPEALVAKDADYLEQAFQARLYQTQGYEGVSQWIINVEKALTTDSAKKLFEQMLKTSPYEWFRGLKKL